MERQGDDMADQDKCQAAPASGYRLVDDGVAEPEPEYHVSDNLEPTMPLCLAFTGSLALSEEDRRLDVEIEPSKSENRIVEIGLIRDQSLGNVVVEKGALVVSGKDVGEKAVVDGEHGKLLVVRIVFWGVGDDMVDIVCTHQPRDRPPMGAAMIMPMSVSMVKS